MTLASLLPWKRVKTADPMQEVPPIDPVQAAYLAQGDNGTTGLDYQRRAYADAAKSEAARIRALAERNAAWVALREIVAAETPGSAPAAKRMARIAREALPEYASKPSDQIAA